MSPRNRHCCAIPLALLLGHSLTAQADNVRLHGALVAQPCVVAPESANVQLDLGAVVDKYLYANQRTHGQAFDIRLTDCDLSQVQTVKMTFSGVENPHLPGLLAIDGSSQASGIAIGMQTQTGQPLPLNNASEGVRLVSGSNTLTVQAYVQGEPQAIARQSIARGPFSATATFNLEYQ